MAQRRAYPDMASGVNPNTPVRLFDTHPNRRIAVGEEVVMVDHEQPNVRGLVLGYAAEDRLWIKWPTVTSQEDVDEVIATSELGNVVSLRDTGVVVRPQSVHTPGAFPKKTAGKEAAVIPTSDEAPNPYRHTRVRPDEQLWGEAEGTWEEGDDDFYEDDIIPDIYGDIEDEDPWEETPGRTDPKVISVAELNRLREKYGHEDPDPRKAGKRGARFSFRKVRKGGGHAFDVYVGDSQVGTIRQTVKSGRRLWKLEGRKREKLYATRKEAAEALCARRKCAGIRLCHEAARVDLKGKIEDVRPHRIRTFSKEDQEDTVQMHKNAHLIRAEGVRELDNMLRVLRAARRPKEAKITARVTRTAMILHMMHLFGQTRRQASHKSVSKWWKRRLGVALSMTKKLRKLNQGRYANVADRLDLALQKAFTYPTTALRVANVQNPSPAFQAVFGQESFKAWDELLHRASSQFANFDPMQAAYEQIQPIMVQMQNELSQGGVRYTQRGQVPEQPGQFNVWHQQQSQVGNPLLTGQ